MAESHLVFDHLYTFVQNQKVCSKCSLLLPITEFNLVHPAAKNGRIRPDCKECVRKRSRKHYTTYPELYRAHFKIVKNKARKRAKAFCNSYLSAHPCVDCGEQDLVVLEFDHVRGTKLSDVSALVQSGARQWRIEEEISKCEVRCANCHRRITAKRRVKDQASIV